MSVSQYVAFMKRRKIIGIKIVTVSRKNRNPVSAQQCIFGKYGEIQYHLIDLTVAVAPYAEKLILCGIKH